MHDTRPNTEIGKSMLRLDHIPLVSKHVTLSTSLRTRYRDRFPRDRKFSAANAVIAILNMAIGILRPARELGRHHSRT
jgi:hypothetical protein